MKIKGSMENCIISRRGLIKLQHIMGRIHILQEMNGDFMVDGPVNGCLLKHYLT